MVICKKNFAAGKEARKNGAGAFVTAASLQYQALDEGEKSHLSTAAENFIEKNNSTMVERKKKAANIF